MKLTFGLHELGTGTEHISEAAHKSQKRAAQHSQHVVAFLSTRLRRLFHLSDPLLNTLGRHLSERLRTSRWVGSGVISESLTSDEYTEKAHLRRSSWCTRS
jgi:hypothetical protein